MLGLILRDEFKGDRLKGTTIDFSAEKGKVKKLDLGPQQSHTFSGDATAKFQDAELFKFQGLPQ